MTRHAGNRAPLAGAADDTVARTSNADGRNWMR